MGEPKRDKNKAQLNVNGNFYEIEEIFLSDLGYLMIRLYSPTKKIYTTYNLGAHDPEKNIFKTAIEEICQKETTR